MKLADLVIGLVMFSMVILGVSSLIGGIGGDYGKVIGSDINSTYNKMSELQTNIEGIENKTIGNETETSWTDFGSLVFKGPIRAIKLVGLSLTIPKDIAVDVQDTGYIPAWFINGIILILSTVVLFLIISAIIKWRTVGDT